MKVRLKNDKPTAAQRKALRAECIKEFDSLIEGFNRDVAIQVFHILHFNFGFGQKRLETFQKKLTEMQVGQEKRYQMTDNELPWICEIQLRDAGIDVEKLLKGDDDEVRQ